MDYHLYRAINGLSGDPFFDRVVKVLASDLPAVLVVLVALLFLIRWQDQRQARRSGAVLATTSAGVALLVSQPIAHATDRLRPYLAHPAHAHLLIARSHDPSFPSDHAAGAFALAMGVWLYDRVFGTALFVIGFVLAFSRVYVGTHYPGDVVGGAVIGLVSAAALSHIPPARRFLEATADAVGRGWDALIGHVTTRRSMPA